MVWVSIWWRREKSDKAAWLTALITFYTNRRLLRWYVYSRLPFVKWICWQLETSSASSFLHIILWEIKGCQAFLYLFIFFCILWYIHSETQWCISYSSEAFREDLDIRSHLAAVKTLFFSRLLLLGDYLAQRGERAFYTDPSRLEWICKAKVKLTTWKGVTEILLHKKKLAYVTANSHLCSRHNLLIIILLPENLLHNAFLFLFFQSTLRFFCSCRTSNARWIQRDCTFPANNCLWPHERAWLETNWLFTRSCKTMCTKG